jgi:uncharacterized membrane protein
MNVLLYVPEQWMPWIVIVVVIFLGIAIVSLIEMGHK